MQNSVIKYGKVKKSAKGHLKLLIISKELLNFYCIDRAFCVLLGIIAYFRP